MAVARDLIAVDLGNSRMKLGRFARLIAAPSTLPEPVETFALPIANKTGEFDVDRFSTWCEQHIRGQAQVSFASVHRAAAALFSGAVDSWARRARRDVPLRQLSYADVPLTIRVDEPPRVGIDRLLAALAVNQIRQQNEPAIIVGLGTAVTVDLLDADGAFAGGAILPGIATSAHALAEHTDALPHVNVERLMEPVALGKSTIAAIESGLYWGTIGAIRELISQLSSRLAAQPGLFLTGGGSWQVADSLASASDSLVRHMPHLVLTGIALVDGSTSDCPRRTQSKKAND
jgi:type III pantothenate kinase